MTNFLPRASKMAIFLAISVLVDCAPKSDPKSATTPQVAPQKQNTKPVDSNNGEVLNANSVEPSSSLFCAVFPFESVGYDMNTLVKDGIVNVNEPESVCIGSFEHRIYRVTILKGQVIELKVTIWPDVTKPEQTIASKKFTGTTKDPVTQVLEDENNVTLICSHDKNLLNPNAHSNLKTSSEADKSGQQ